MKTRQRVGEGEKERSIAEIGKKKRIIVIKEGEEKLRDIDEYIICQEEFIWE